MSDTVLDPHAADRLPDVNVPLLRKAIDWATAEAVKPANEREWYQRRYRWPAQVRSEYMEAQCQTAYCIAGYACHVAGLDWSNEHDENGLTDGRGVGDAAGELLGITDDERDRLFESSNDIAAVQAIASEIAARAGERL